MRIGMIPYLTGDEWETKGNPHLVKLVQSLTNSGWEVVPLDSNDFARSDNFAQKNIDLIFIHWPSSIFDLIGFSNSTFTGKFINFLKRGSVTEVQKSGKRVLSLLEKIHNLCLEKAVLRHSSIVAKNIEGCAIPVIWELHDLGSHHVTDQTELATIEKRFHGELYSVCSGIVVHEDSCVKAIFDEYGSERPYVVAKLGPYSYGPPVSKGDARRRLGITNSGRVIAYIGTARPNRNPAETVTAFSRVAGKEDRLIVAGMGGGAYIPKGFQDQRVKTFDFFLPPDQMRDVFCAADFVVNDAERYLTSAVVRAAMGYGVPVIVRPFGSVLDMAKDAALFISDEGLEEILRAALRLDQKQYEVLSCEARKRDAERTWEESGAKVDGFLRTFLTQQQHPAMNESHGF